MGCGRAAHGSVEVLLFGAHTLPAPVLSAVSQGHTGPMSSRAARASPSLGPHQKPAPATPCSCHSEPGATSTLTPLLPAGTGQPGPHSPSSALGSGCDMPGSSQTSTGAGQRSLPWGLLRTLDLAHLNSLRQCRGPQPSRPWPGPATALCWSQGRLLPTALSPHSRVPVWTPWPPTGPAYGRAQGLGLCLQQEFPAHPQPPVSCLERPREPQ